MSRIKLAHRTEHLLFSALMAGSGRIGRSMRARLGDWLGRLAYRPLAVRRTLVERHLRQAFPEKDAEWVQETARQTYEHFGRELFETARMASLTPAQLERETVVDGLEPLLDAARSGTGAVLTAAHLGNWEIACASLSVRGVPLEIIAQKQRNPLFNQAIVDARQRFGSGIIYRGRAPKEALRALRAGRIVIFGADQNAGRHGVFVPFFGTPASTHRGAALMAVRTGTPLFFAAARRLPDGRHQLRVEQVDVDRDGPVEDAVQRMTAAFTARLEAAVRETPEQYFWFHKRWKTRPPKEPAQGESVQ